MKHLLDSYHDSNRLVQRSCTSEHLSVGNLCIPLQALQPLIGTQTARCNKQTTVVDPVVTVDEVPASLLT